MYTYSSNRCSLCDCTNIPECEPADPYKFNPSLGFITKGVLVICSDCNESIEDSLSEDNFLDEEEEEDDDLSR